MTANQVISTCWSVVPVLLVIFAIRPVSRREIVGFSENYGVKVTQETLPAMTNPIRRARAARLAGAAVGLSVHNVFSGLGVTIPNQGVIYAICGYLLGAFVTALIPSGRTSARRRASLVPRVARDYLPRAALVAPIVIVGISALATLAYELEPHRNFATFSGDIAALPVSAVVVVSSYVGITLVVARPQPIASSSLTVIDDALRTQAIHTISAVGLAISFAGLSTCLFQMAGYTSFGWLRVTGVVLAVAALCAMFASWSFRQARWQVRRVTAT